MEHVGGMVSSWEISETKLPTGTFKSWMRMPWDHWASCRRMKVAVKEERILGERGAEEGLTEEEEELEDTNSSENDEDRPVRIIRLGTEEVKKYAILG